VDVAALFPELLDHSRPATRLHPRPGTPSIEDSSIGGQLLWPAAEPWPHCDGPHHYQTRMLAPATVRQHRAMLDEVWRRTPPGEGTNLTDHERATLLDFSYSEPFELAQQPVAMIPVVQVYRRDTPGFLGPADSDLMQVLWCPLVHDWLDYCPRLVIKWRRLADTGEVLVCPPEPSVVADSFLPDQCVLHPEQVAEFDDDGLPEELRARIESWERESGYDYFGDLSIAPGWKIGGFGRWNLSGPRPMVCDCGADLSVLMGVDGSEWDADSGSWRPVEDASRDDEPRARPRPDEPTGITIGRGYTLWVYYCPRSYDHPHQTAMQ